MPKKTLDVRSATCPGGGAIWSLLSHTRELPRGDSIELLTDDYLAPVDIPEWAARVGWTVTLRDTPDGFGFDVVRPA